MEERKTPLVDKGAAIEKTPLADADAPKELDQDELDSINGGSNPFADIPRVKNHDYDQTVKDKI